MGTIAIQTQKLYDRVINRFHYMLSAILYERPKERLFLLLNFMFFAFVKLIKPSLSLKAKEKIRKYYLSFYRANLFRHPAPFLNFCRATLRICITYKCNISCKICYARDLLEKFPMDMSLDDFVYLIKWAKAKGWKGINFLGGEPTIHPQFEEILDICYSQGMSVTLSSNGLFNDKILRKLRSPFIRDIGVNYPEEHFPLTQRRQCLHNLEELAKEKFILGISEEIDGKDDNWKKVIETAARLKASIRWSLLLPGYARTVSNQVIFGNPRLIGSQLFEILKTCVEKNVTCFVYRPVLICMFTPQQLQQIRKMGRYLIFTRCMLGYRGDYTLALTVNPDLSTYPCNSLFIKGPHITSFKDRASINHYYEKIDKDVMSISPVKKCDNCQFFKNFLSTIKDKRCLVNERLFDENICQAGCVDFRDYRGTALSC